MHAGPIDPNEWLRKERGRVPHGSSHLAADQFVQLHIVCRTNDIRVGKVHFELRRRDLWMVFFVLEAQCTLCLRRLINELAKRVHRERVIVPAR